MYVINTRFFMGADLRSRCATYSQQSMLTSVHKFLIRIFNYYFVSTVPLLLVPPTTKLRTPPSFYEKKRKKIYPLPLKCYVSFTETLSAIRIHVKRGGVLNFVVGTVHYLNPSIPIELRMYIEFGLGNFSWPKGVDH
jgi:hypothetical protein